jgi:hypothetical protein
MNDPNGTLVDDNLEPVGSASQLVSPQSLELASMPVTGQVEADETLVVEVAAPDQSGAGGFWPGSNSVGQSGPGYLRAEACGLPEPVNLAALGFAVVVAPAVAMRWQLMDDGLGGIDSDILIASIFMGLVHVVVSVWMTRRSLVAHRRWTPVWLARINALVVLALSASLLLQAVLWYLPEEQHSLASRGFAVVLVWCGIQLVAIVLAEATAYGVLRWLRAPAAAAALEAEPLGADVEPAEVVPSP